MSIQVKTCKNCIGNMTKHCARCQNCCEYDNHMTKNQMNKIKNELSQAKSKKDDKIKSIQLNRIKFLCQYIKGDAGRINKTRILDNGNCISVFNELKQLCNMRKNKDYNKIY